ncbi:helix-turn-helix transcriptional regulator [Streptomyces rubiginosohelvolus]
MGQDVTSTAPSTTDERFLTTEEVAARYRTSPTTVSWWRRTHYGPKGIKVGRRVLYPQAEIERFERSLAEEQTERSA